MPKEPTRAQLSSKLAYQAHKPAFLQKLQNRIAGLPDSDEEHEDPNDEFEYVGGGRPPIPKRPTERPAIPERPADDPGSADDDDDDEKPQVVVLKEGKHLSEREVVNIKRKEKGLAPLPDPEDIVAKLANPDLKSKSSTSSKKEKDTSKGLSFSSSSTSKLSKSAAKRKALSQLDEDEDEDEDGKDKDKDKKQKKKAKKTNKTLLSFEDT